jgi:valyl-tRNA synthetase
VLIKTSGERDVNLVHRHERLLARLAGLASIEFLDSDADEPISASAILQNMLLLVPMKGLIDPAAEIDRLSRKINKNEADIARLQAKLRNENFVRNAPPEVVALDRGRADELLAQNMRLARQLERVGRLKNA